jgi:hypothetical protein
MAGAWAFNQNCWVDFYLNPAQPPVPPPTVASVQGQYLPPNKGPGDNWLRVVIPWGFINIVSEILSPSALGPLICSIYDDSNNAAQWFTVVFYSPHFYQDSGGNMVYDAIFLYLEQDAF